MSPRLNAERCPDEPYKLSSASALLIALVDTADNQGRHYGDPRMLKGLAWDDDAVTPAVVYGWLAELLEQQQITVEGQGEFATLSILNRNDYPRFQKRRPVPVAVRREVYERDGFQCVQCGTTDDLSLDHIKPFSKGGLETVENLRVLCRPCNCRKGNRE